MYEDRDYCERDCCRKRKFVKVFIDCGKECICLCGIFIGIECKCCNKKVMIIKTKRGKKVFINFDKISYWKFCDGWD